MPDGLAADVKHFVTHGEAEFLVDGLPAFRCMQRDDANTAAPSLFQAVSGEGLCQAAPPIGRLDKYVQHVGALVAGGIEEVRRPVEHQQAGGRDVAVSIADDPADVFSSIEHAPHPWIKVPRHLFQNRDGSVPHISEHCLAMAGDQRGIFDGSHARFKHALSIGTEAC
jgi:hypothetical protein